jgi:predicted nucleic acid-binding protein
MTKQEKVDVANIKSVFNGHIQARLNDYLIGGRSPPGNADCGVLAFALVRQAIVVTDDVGLHILAVDFKMPVW